MATVYIAEASIDERGQIAGGQLGDQGNEVHIRPWYASGWNVVLRFKDSKVRQAVAQIAEKLANSSAVGYDQSERMSLYNALRSTNWNVDKYLESKIPTAADCSSFVFTCYCCKLRTLRGGNVTTSTIANTLSRYGFSQLRSSEYLTDSNKLQVGDILVDEGTHACMVVSNKGTVVDDNNTEEGHQDNASAQASIDASKITPFIATPSSDNISINYNKLKKLGVVGMMFYGGSYYDSHHNTTTTYYPQHLSEQVKQCDKSKLPYGLHVKVRSQSVNEAKQECQSLYYVLSNYPPKLGIWLELELSTKRSINDKILDTYYDYICQWGLQDRCGLYVTHKELSKITWDKFYDRFLLWMIDHVKDIDDVDGQLLTPEFFEVESK